MRVWAACVVVFFGVAELYQWLQDVTLPLPVYGIAGLLLAVISNSDKWRLLSSGQLSNPSLEQSINQFMHPSLNQPDHQATDPALTSTVSPGAEQPLIESSQTQNTVAPAQTSHPRYYPGPQLPNLTPFNRLQISFTLRKPKSSD